MQKFFGVEINTSNMTFEELKDARKEARDLLFKIEHEITFRQLHKCDNSSDCPTLSKI